MENDLTKGFLISEDGKLAGVSRQSSQKIGFPYENLQGPNSLLPNSLLFEAYIVNTETGEPLHYSHHASYQEAHKILDALCQGWEYAPASGCQGGACEKCASSVCIPEAKKLCANFQH